jgi:hypothetical protein
MAMTIPPMRPGLRRPVQAAMRTVSGARRRFEELFVTNISTQPPSAKSAVRLIDSAPHRRRGDELFRMGRGGSFEATVVAGAIPGSGSGSRIVLVDRFDQETSSSGSTARGLRELLVGALGLTVRFPSGGTAGRPPTRRQTADVLLLGFDERIGTSLTAPASAIAHRERRSVQLP